MAASLQAKLGGAVISITKYRRDKCAYDFAVCHAHPKKQVVSFVVKPKPPQRNRRNILA
jgi:hypothetical protein